MGPLCGRGSKGSWTRPLGVKVQKVQKVLPAPGRQVQRVVVSPAAMSIKTALRDFPPGMVILSLRRRISVHAVFESIGDKYQSAAHTVITITAIISISAFAQRP
jgi:hypothetical protein